MALLCRVPVWLAVLGACGAGNPSGSSADGGGTGGDGGGVPGADGGAPITEPGDLEVDPGCPGVFNPDQVLDYTFEIDPGDWATVLADGSYSVFVPASMQCGDGPVLAVGVRRKRSGGTNKVGLKVDINQYVAGQRYYGLRKLSLENGVSEGTTSDATPARDYLSEYLAWRLMAASGAMSGRAAFARVLVNGDVVGVYVNVEQVDKTFLDARLGDDTGWLYKKSGGVRDGLKTHELDGLDDPYDDYFCFWGRGAGSACPIPSAAELAAELPVRLDIPQLLRVGAVNAVIANTDAPIGKDNNYYWYDWHAGGRVYFPWDLDTTMKRAETVFPSSPYTEALFTHWRPDYVAIVEELIAGPLSKPAIEAELARAGAAASAAFASDPTIEGSLAGAIDELDAYWDARLADVAAELAAP